MSDYTATTPGAPLNTKKQFLLIETGEPNVSVKMEHFNYHHLDFDSSELKQNQLDLMPFQRDSIFKKMEIVQDVEKQEAMEEVSLFMKILVSKLHYRATVIDQSQQNIQRQQTSK